MRRGMTVCAALIARATRDALYRRVVAALRKDRPDLALNAIAEVGRPLADSGWGLRLHAGVLECMGNYVAAERLLRRAARVAPRDLSTAVELIELLRDGGLHDRAMKEIVAVRRKVRRGGFRGRRMALEVALVVQEARLARAQGKLREAVRVLARGLTVWPESKDLAESLVIALSKRPMTGGRERKTSNSRS